MFLSLKDHFILCLYVCSAAALCLAQALLKCPVLKSLGPGWDHAGAVEGVGPPSLKENIMSWLLMNEQSEEAEESSRPHPIICRWAVYHWAHIAFLFTLNLSASVV